MKKLNKILKLFKKKYFIHKTSIIYFKKNRNLLDIKYGAEIWEYVIIRLSDYKLSLHENCQIGPFTVIFGGTNISIGKNTMIAPHCVIAGGNHNYKQTKIPMRHIKGYTDGPIIIEDDVWIGSNCTILDNTKIGKGSIIGANSVVTRDIPPYSIAVGCPAKIIKKRNK